MSLKITKDRSNIYNLELRETVEEFIDNLNNGIKSSYDGLFESTNSLKDALYEWDSSYKNFYQHMSDSYKMEEYKSLYVG